MGLTAAQKSEKRRAKRQRAKQRKQELRQVDETFKKAVEETSEGAGEEEVVVEWVEEEIDHNLRISQPELHEHILKHFTPKDEEDEEEHQRPEGSKFSDVAPKQDNDEDDDEDKPALSNKALKKLNRLTLAELKQLVDRPDVVEEHDCNALNPKLLVYLKSYRNTVPVPVHWSQKRKYLAGKLGHSKIAWDLPQFLLDTGIAEIRERQLAKDKENTTKQNQRARVNPKMGKIDIDYQVLHDAFFKYQTKPEMTIFGDVYYEGREWECKYNKFRPGRLTQKMQAALGMTANSPPPWLINMQRFGPPLAYPDLKIPGLNSPIPPGSRFGYGEGQWGKPPVDRWGRPLYGDPFGQGLNDPNAEYFPEIIKEHWGMMEEEEESSDEESSSDEDEDGSSDDDSDDDGQSVMDPSGTESVMSTMSGISSTMSGLTTPGSVDVRKSGVDTPLELRKSAHPKQLYTVLQEQSASVGQNTFGSSHTYNVAPQKKGQVNVALQPEDLASLDEETLKRKYAAAMAQGQQESVTTDYTRVQKKQRRTKNKSDETFKF